MPKRKRDNKPICCKRILCGEKHCKLCYSRSFATSDKAIYWSAKNLKQTHEVFLSSSTKYILDCPTCHHEFECSPGNVKNGRWCPFCPVKKYRLCGVEDCTHCWNRSLAATSVMDHFELIGDNAWTIHSQSRNSYHWRCKACCHTFDREVWFLYSRLRNRKHDVLPCPYCTTILPILCYDDNCKRCWSKSLASNPVVVSLLDETCDLKLRQISKTATNTIIPLRCKTCNHRYELPARLVDQVGCTYCGRRSLCLEDCNFCYDMSLASSDIAQYWDYEKNADIPRNIHKCSGETRFFICENGHSFSAALNHLSRPSDPTWCPYCINKTEGMLFEYLKTVPQIQVQKPNGFDWCRNPSIQRRFLFDFLIFIGDKKIICELDGPHHFRVVDRFKTDLQENRTRDKFKMRSALDNGYYIIRLYQPFVWSNQVDWRSELLQSLSDISKHCGSPTVTFLDLGSGCYNSDWCLE